MKRFVAGADRAQSTLLPDKLEAIADRGYFSGEQILTCDNLASP